MNKISVVLFVFVVMLTGCTSMNGDAPVAPINYDVFVYENNMQAVEEQVLAYFRKWANETELDLSNSSFSLIEIQPEKQTYTILFTATIPENWGENENNKKLLFLSAYVKDIKTLLQGGKPPNINPVPPVQLGHTSGVTSLFVIPDKSDNVAPIAGVYLIPLQNQTGNQSFNISIVCDVSNSTGFIPCNQSELSFAYRYFFRNAIESSSGSFSIWKVGNERETAKRIEHFSIDEKPPAERVACLLLKKKTIALLNLSMEKKPASAIVQALGLAADDIRERSGHRLILLFSDGRQIDHLTRLNLEHNVPIPEQFLKVLERKGQLLDLTDIEVQMYGVGSHVRNSVIDENKLKKCWEMLFKQCGAKQFSIYRNSFGELQTNSGGNGL